MDAIIIQSNQNVAFLKDGLVIQSIAYRKEGLDSELEGFKSELGADSFVRYEFDEVVDEAGNVSKIQKPFPSWIWSDLNRSFQPPIAYPESGDWQWDESVENWVEFAGE